MTEYERRITAWDLFTSAQIDHILEDTASNVAIENYERKIDTFLAVNAAGRGDLAVKHVSTFLRKVDTLSWTLPLDQRSRFLFTVIPLLSVYGFEDTAVAA